MRIVITESQKRRILLESTGEELANIMKQGVDSVKYIIDELKNKFNFDLQFLLTWGASVGGFISPIAQFVSGKYPELTDYDIALILLGVISTYYYENKKLIREVYDKINEEGLTKIFKDVLKKSDELKNTFVDFLNSLGVTFHKVSNIFSYSFIIPLIPTLLNITLDGSFDGVDLREVAVRILSYGAVSVSTILFKEIFTKIIRRFREK
jgi:CRISPR/Cas system CSM-associated protein Csm2 small subunit